MWLLSWELLYRGCSQKLLFGCEVFTVIHDQMEWCKSSSNKDINELGTPGALAGVYFALNFHRVLLS